MQSYIYYEATLSDKVTLIVSQCVDSDTLASSAILIKSDYQ
jgi:hypothetical protein